MSKMCTVGTYLDIALSLLWNSSTRDCLHKRDEKPLPASFFSKRTFM